MDAAIDRLIADLTDSGVVSAAGNRRALRSGEEPLEEFRRYMAVYAREQADCHFSPALIRNLEKHWDAANRRGYPTSRNSRTIAIWSSCMSVGACPMPGSSTSFAFGPRSVIARAVSRDSRSDCAPRMTSVGQRTAS
jgi:hypothetical protein